MNDDEDQKKFELDSRRWANRRHLAWSSFLLAAVQTIGLLSLLFTASVDRVEAVAQYGAIIMAVYGFCAGIIMAYVGTAAYSDVRLQGS